MPNEPDNKTQISGIRTSEELRDRRNRRIAVFVYQPERALKSAPEGFCWTKDAGSVTVGLDETG
jgi:hypothetical protein